MILFILAIVPSIVLLIYIYKKDKREKEPFGILLSCFLLGVISIIPAVIMENILSSFFDHFLTEGSILYAICDGFIVAAFSEELCKYIMLKGASWKSKNFNCSFDGIVYAVFVSLGFATLENILYVVDGDLFTAMLRMFSSVPSHACDAVFMGYYYSKAKYANLTGDTKNEKKYKRYTLLIPIFAHGLYDCLLGFDGEVVGDFIYGRALLGWFVFVIVTFVLCFLMVKRASLYDKYFYEQTDARNINPEFLLKQGVWICSCGNINNGKFCTFCGSKKPDAGQKLNESPGR